MKNGYVSGHFPARRLVTRQRAAENHCHLFDTPLFDCVEFTVAAKVVCGALNCGAVVSVGKSCASVRNTHENAEGVAYYSTREC